MKRSQKALPPWAGWLVVAGLVSFVVWVVAVDQVSDGGAYGAGQAVGEGIRRYAWMVFGILLLWFFAAQAVKVPPRWFRRHPALTAVWGIVVVLVALGSFEGDTNSVDALNVVIVAAFQGGLIVLGIGWVIDWVKSLRATGPPMPQRLDQREKQ